MKLDNDNKIQTQQKFGRSALYLAPALILILGSLLHYHRGYYGIGVTAIHARGSDDAYITYRYGWNLLNFNSLSWNESGYRRTEGFTNPLWVLGSVVWSIPRIKDWVYPLSVLTSIILCTLLLLFLTHLIYKKYGSYYSIIGLILVSAMPAIWLHVTSGLESGVYGFGLAVLTYFSIFGEDLNIRAIILIVLTVLLGFVRSDAFIYLIPILIASIIVGNHSWKYLVVGLIISLVPILIWRYLSFGSWLPNTAVAKINFPLFERISGGLEFILLPFYKSGLFVLLIFGFVGLLYLPKRSMFAGGFIILSWLIYFIFIGGDWGIERHLVGIYILCAAISAPLWQLAKPTTRGLFILILGSTILISIFSFGNRFRYFSEKSKDPWIMLGKALEEDRDKYGILVTRAAGKIAFYAGGECIDAIGLNDPFLATIKQDEFVPGHSSGSNEAAIELAKNHPLGKYSTLTYLGSRIIDGPEDISLWVDITNPQDEVQYQVSPGLWKEVNQIKDPPIWSIISKPIMTNSDTQ